MMARIVAVQRGEHYKVWGIEPTPYGVVQVIPGGPPPITCDRQGGVRGISGKLEVEGPTGSVQVEGGGLEFELPVAAPAVERLPSPMLRLHFCLNSSRHSLTCISLSTTEIVLRTA